MMLVILPKLPVTVGKVAPQGSDGPLAMHRPRLQLRKAFGWFVANPPSDLPRRRAVGYPARYLLSVASGTHRTCGSRYRAVGQAGASDFTESRFVILPSTSLALSKNVALPAFTRPLYFEKACASARARILG